MPLKNKLARLERFARRCGIEKATAIVMDGRIRVVLDYNGAKGVAIVNPSPTAAGGLMSELKYQIAKEAKFLFMHEASKR